VESQTKSDVQKKITEDVAKYPVLLYVKGTPQAPMCGFSKGVMDIFQKLGVEFKTIDVLEDSGIRDGVKQFSSWPTIPQIFIQGKFVGGYDIVRDLYQKGELQKMLKS